MRSTYRISNKDFLLIDDPVPHGAFFNMEFDWWLFRLMEEGGLKNALRLYEWEAPSITCGKFQDIGREIVKEQCEKDGIAVVKRPTGGRAILHSDELTFSAIIHPASLEPYTFRNCYLFIAELLADAFSGLGVAASIRLASSRYGEKALCFHSVSQYEITDREGRKLAGIAQLFRKSGVLLQGSIPLKENRDYHRYFRSSGSIRLENGLIGKNLAARELRRSVVRAAGKRLSLHSFLASSESAGS